MYWFIFYFIYRAKLKADGTALTRYSASLIVAIYLVVHLSLLYALIRFYLCYFWQISIARHNVHANSQNNFIYFFLFALILFLVYKFFTERRIGLILNKYSCIENFYGRANISKFILLFLIPLLISIFIVNKSVLYCN